MTAHVAFHFALGMAAGSIVGVRIPFRAWYSRQPMSEPFLRWLAWCYGAGVYAVVPSILRSLGVPRGVCSHWVMNVFLLHPLINRVRPGGLLVGESLMGLIAGTQYLLLILAVRAALRARRP